MAPPWWPALRNDYVLALQAALQEEEEIKELLRALTKAGITPILLKGADLRLRVYGDPAVRPMADLETESLGYLTIHAGTLYHHRRLSDWFFYLKVLGWPPKEYLTAIYGRPDRKVFFRQILIHLFSYAQNWGPH